ncbi:MAG: prolipoprotein diacylglyceryl transferase [Clostridia bacterium]|nr:prolipoprotein diacylglyceryl transferase [Clostridia bacterium]
MNLLNPGIELFGITIYYYAIIIVSGMVIAALCSALLMKRRNMSPDLILTLFIVCIPSALVCARLYYCITKGDLPISQWINFRDGGLSVLGGLIGGITAGLIVCLVKKVPFFRAADCVLPTIPLAQAIGRWGNFVNEEVYGQVVTNPALQFFPIAVNIDGTWHYALFFYECIINLVWFAMLFSLAWHFAKKPNGLFSGAFVAFYGVVRSIMEPLRDEQFILGGSEVMHSRITSWVMIGVGLAIIVAALAINYKKEGCLIGSKRGDPCAITEFIANDKKEDKPDTKINLMKEKYLAECSQNEKQNNPSTTKDKSND